MYLSLHPLGTLCFWYSLPVCLTDCKITQKLKIYFDENIYFDFKMNFNKNRS